VQVLRDGKVRSMDAVDIVPGDILMVRLGDIVPADIKLLGDEEAGEDEQTPMQVCRQTMSGGGGFCNHGSLQCRLEEALQAERLPHH